MNQKKRNFKQEGTESTERAKFPKNCRWTATAGRTLDRIYKMNRMDYRWKKKSSGPTHLNFTTIFPRKGAVFTQEISL